MTHQTLSAPNAIRTQPLSKFEQLFRLWLAGYGVTEEQCDKLCAKPRIAMSLRNRDSGGLVIDLPGEVAGMEQAVELRKALATPREQLLLLISLK